MPSESLSYRIPLTKLLLEASVPAALSELVAESDWKIREARYGTHLLFLLEDSTTMWTLCPETLVPEIVAMWLPPLRGRSTREWRGTIMFLVLEILRDNSVTLIMGGTMRCVSTRVVTINPKMPAASTECPMLACKDAYSCESNWQLWSNSAVVQATVVCGQNSATCLDE